MKGFICLARRGVIGLAAIAVAFGCYPARLQAGDGACCQGCGAPKRSLFGCSNGCRRPFFDQLREDIREFDYEQLHPDHCWPDQYSRESRRRVNEPFRIQMENGHVLETTLWAHYFSTEKGKEHELADSGKARLQYLARKKPFVIPTLRLQSSFDRELDQKRVAAAIEYANKVSLEPMPWTVSVVNAKATGLFGPEGPKAISKMVGLPGAAPLPQYEPNIKQSFYSSGSGSTSGN